MSPREGSGFEAGEGELARERGQRGLALGLQAELVKMPKARVVSLPSSGPHYFECQARTSKCGIYSRTQRFGQSRRCHIVDIFVPFIQQGFPPWP